MIGRSRQEPPPEAASATEPIPEPQLIRHGIFGQVATFCFWRQPKKPRAREVPPFDARAGLAVAGDPNRQHDGKRVMGWHFLADKGHHYMVDADGRAVMFNGTTKAVVTGDQGGVRGRGRLRASPDETRLKKPRMRPSH